jgi:hypothetical protein
MLEHLFGRHFRRRAFVAVACCVLVLQTFLAGLHAAEMNAATDQALAAICHSGGGGAENPGAGGKHDAAALLCPLCTLLTATPIPGPLASTKASIVVAELKYFSRIDALAVVLPPPRAGHSRAPPQII